MFVYILIYAVRNRTFSVRCNNGATKRIKKILNYLIYRPFRKKIAVSEGFEPWIALPCIIN